MTDEGRAALQEIMETAVAMLETLPTMQDLRDGCEELANQIAIVERELEPEKGNRQ